MKLYIKLLSGIELEFTMESDDLMVSQILEFMHHKRADFQSGLSLEDYKKLIKLVYVFADSEKDKMFQKLEENGKLADYGIADGSRLVELYDLPLVSTLIEPYLEDITALYNPESTNPNPEVALKAFRAIINCYETAQDKAFSNYNILDNIQFLQEILKHPCPQNCAGSFPYVGQEDGWCMVRLEPQRVKGIVEMDGKTTAIILLKNGRIMPKAGFFKDAYIGKEQEGLLGLTVREDDRLPPITKEDVMNYIHYRLSQLIAEVKLKISEKKTISDEKNLISEPNSAVDTQQAGEIELIQLKEELSILDNSYLLINQTLSNERHESSSTVLYSSTQRSNERQFNFWEKETLKELKSHGLTAQMLLNRNKNGVSLN
jgi:hypothetical protein